MKKAIYFILFLFLSVSCRKVIDIKVSDTEPKLVIEARYDANKEEVLVRISKTVNVFSTDSIPKISGAKVKIIDVFGNSTFLNDNGDGTYFLSDYSPVYNSLYTMEVEIEGINFIASDTLVPVLLLDSLASEYHDASLFMEEGYTVSLYFKDPSGRNYNRVIQKVNGEYLEDLSDQFMFSDLYSDTQEREISIYWKNFVVDDTVQVEFLSYSKKTYDYYLQLFDVVSGSEFSSAPANPAMTWRTEEDETPCLGNFSAFGYDVKTIVIKD